MNQFSNFQIFKFSNSLNKFLLTSYFLLLASFSFASHFMGGEITWTCDTTNNGKFHFHMKLYRECGGVTFKQSEILEIINYPDSGKVTKIYMNLKNVTDISPVCNSLGPAITCATASQSGTGAVSEYYYTSDTLLNQTGVSLTGHPPSTGWIFAYKGGNRNKSDNIINAEQQTWFLRSVMYPYKGIDTKVCYDNSPTFAEKPNTVICTGYPFTYNPNAYDIEYDKLQYEWAQPLDSNHNPLIYNTNYTYTNPLPDASFNPSNVPATIDPNTGEISFSSFTQGAFLTVSVVTAYKNGIKVAEIFREMQIELLQCGNNIPPDISPPFKDKMGLFTLFRDTVYAGQVVDFHIAATDNIGQLITLNVSGPDFGTNANSTTTGCITPPCAIIRPPPTLSGSSPVETDFHWQTDCNHLTHDLSIASKNHLIYNKPTISNVHNFVFNVQDDFCPVPGRDIRTITIVVLNKPIIPAPALHCVSVDTNGFVNLTWIPVKDSAGSFYGYYIYRSDSVNGIYNIIDSIFSINTSTYIDNKINANNQAFSYYLITKSACNHAYLSSPSDTLSAMRLKVSPNPKTGTVDIKWNSLHYPRLSSSNLTYDLYRKVSNGKWQKIASPSSQLKTPITYTDIFAACRTFVYYRVKLTDSSRCTSASSVAGALLQDNSQPDYIYIDTVSIDPVTKKTVIGWHHSTSGDVDEYIIYKYNNTRFFPFDSVSGYNTTYYQNPKSSPYSGYETYGIAARDSCINYGKISPPHNTLFLSATLDICNSEITLSWNPYIHMDSLAGYRLYCSENNGPFSILTTIINSKKPVTGYVHTDLKPLTKYCYFVRAFDTSGLRTSTSNDTCVLSIFAKKPSFAYLRYATVVQDASGEHIDVRCIADSSAYISKYVILRADSLNGTYIQISTLSNINKYDFTFSDLNVNPGKQSYAYKVEVYDSCSELALTSNPGRTILLTGSPGIDLNNNLSWNSYAQWDVPVAGYHVYRQLPATVSQPLVPYTLLSNLLPATSYIDNISNLTLNAGDFTYVVEALEASGSFYGFQDSSRSNAAVIAQEPKFFIPNAFNPVGENPVFIPVGIFNNPQDYYFAIFNRWGSEIFSTTVPNKGWDGYVNGKLAPLGIYVYILRYKDTMGHIFIKKGSVALLR
jgi:gliding motility-associated-like protein